MSEDNLSTIQVADEIIETDNHPKVAYRRYLVKCPSCPNTRWLTYFSMRAREQRGSKFCVQCVDRIGRHRTPVPALGSIVHGHLVHSFTDGHYVLRCQTCGNRRRLIESQLVMRSRPSGAKIMRCRSCT